jgi:Xaa-Pro dipeptidase
MTSPGKIYFWNDGEDAAGILADKIQAIGAVHRIAVEGSLPARVLAPLVAKLPDCNWSLGDNCIAPLRNVKTAEEIAIIREASGLAEEALAETLGRGEAYWVGRTENDFREALYTALRQRGIAPEAISAVGPNAAEPHYSTGNAVIATGTCLLVDYWGQYKGYWTDSTRTVFFGTPDDEYITVYNTVHAALDAAQAAVHPGVPLCDIDVVARKVITDAGYGEYFTHRTGHGIGMEEHEGSGPAPGDTTPIQNGMVFSIEPGIYLPGRFGVRLENLVAIQNDKAEVLHNFPLQALL